MHSPSASKRYSVVNAIEWLDSGKLRLLDQRLLPEQEVYIELADHETVADAIHAMVVRGAPAIGITAAYGVVLAAKAAYQQHGSSWKEEMQPALDRLAHSRPTAVNLFWALDKMQHAMNKVDETNPVAILLSAAKSIHHDDIEANVSMGDAGAQSIMDMLPGKEKVTILTHCNTGSLATGGYGTALGVIRSLFNNNRLEQVFADETRPWLQGARLTAWELMQDGIPVTLNADVAAAHLMQSGKIDCVIVGADRITANGDVANKIGTYQLAVLCRFHGIKFVVAAPTSTLDMSMVSGTLIPIEQRTGEEITVIKGAKIAPEGVDTYNPVFDVTPADLIDAIVTERGVVYPPYVAGLKSLGVD